MHKQPSEDTVETNHCCSPSLWGEKCPKKVKEEKTVLATYRTPLNIYRTPFKHHLQESWDC